jgi:hypothetical protein
VIGAAATAIAVPLINAAFAPRGDQRRFNNERRQRDLDERRALLDDGAHALIDYIDATSSLVGRFAFSPSSGETRKMDFYMDKLDASIAAKALAYSLNRRLVIRLGRTNDVVVVYGHVLKMLDEATTDVGTRITERTLNRPDGREELLVRQGALRRSWDAGHERFLDTATDLVGSP